MGAQQIVPSNVTGVTNRTTSFFIDGEKFSLLGGYFFGSVDNAADPRVNFWSIFHRLASGGSLAIKSIGVSPTNSCPDLGVTCRTSKTVLNRVIRVDRTFFITFNEMLAFAQDNGIITRGITPAPTEQTMMTQDPEIAVVNKEESNLFNEPSIVEEPLTEQIDQLLIQQRQEFEETGMIITEEFRTTQEQPQQPDGLAPLLLLALVAFAG